MKEEKLGEKGSDKVELQILGKRVTLIRIKKKEGKNLVLMQYQYINTKLDEWEGYKKIMVDY